MTAEPSRVAPPTYEDADLEKIYATVSRTRAAQMRGANRIDELQDAHDAHDASLRELGETLSRIEAKLDRLLGSDQPG